MKTQSLSHQHQTPALLPVPQTLHLSHPINWRATSTPKMADTEHNTPSLVVVLITHPSPTTTHLMACIFLLEHLANNLLDSYSSLLSKNCTSRSPSHLSFFGLRGNCINRHHAFPPYLEDLKIDSIFRTVSCISLREDQFACMHK